MIAVLDIGVSNIGSVCNALKFLKYQFKVIKDDASIPETVTKIILPGVGSYFEAAKRLEKSVVLSSLQDIVLNNKVPILGICLGMQLLTRRGYEHGEAQGLGFIDAEVVKIELEDTSLVLPHMGWNEVQGDKDSALFNEIKQGECFYFVHGYECVIQNSLNVSIGYTDYGRDIVASFVKDNIYGVQFHPEKSQKVGLQLLRNFVELC